MLDPMTVSSLQSIFTTVQSFITGTLLPSAVGLFVLSLGIRLAFKTVRKFAKI